MSRFFTSIPDPNGSQESMLDAIKAMKQTVELLAGQRGGLAPARVFVQATTPVALREGDLWVKTNAANKLLVWTNNAWLSVTV